jgi:hypothetical protein
VHGVVFAFFESGLSDAPIPGHEAGHCFASAAWSNLAASAAITRSTSA